MKHLFLIFAIITSFVSLSQSSKKYEMYSDIWILKRTESGRNTMILKNQSESDGNNIFEKFDSLTKLADIHVINSILFEKFNEFRKDYNIPAAASSVKLNKDCINMAKHLSIKFGHLKNKPYNYAESIVSVRIESLYTITKQQDINEIIAECLFDAFIPCSSHTDMLLSNNKFLKFGVGAYQKDREFYIAVRYIDTRYQ